MNTLLRTPREFQHTVSKMLEMFWTKDFRLTWEFLSPRLENSREEKERLFEACSLQEFVKLSLIRIEIDERKNVIRALRGGYEMPFRHLAQAFVIPSAFKDIIRFTGV